MRKSIILNLIKDVAVIVFILAFIAFNAHTSIERGIDALAVAGVLGWLSMHVDTKLVNAKLDFIAAQVSKLAEFQGYEIPDLPD